MTKGGGGFTMGLQELPYSRSKAVTYAHRWAYFRNPDYVDYRGTGGDSTSFASQCVYAGSDVMNYSSACGWFYISPSDRSASWAGVTSLYHFLVSNDGAGPYGYSTDRQGVLAGDLVQLAFEGRDFIHTLFIVMIRGKPTLDNILVAAHTSDADCRPLSSYPFTAARFVHIEAVRSLVPV